MPRHAYETDFAAWASEQAELIRAGRLDALEGVKRPELDLGLGVPGQAEDSGTGEDRRTA